MDHSQLIIKYEDCKAKCESLGLDIKAAKDKFYLVKKEPKDKEDEEPIVGFESIESLKAWLHGISYGVILCSKKEADPAKL